MHEEVEKRNSSHDSTAAQLAVSKVAAEDQSIAACAKAMLAAEALRAPPRGVDPDAVVACGDAAEAEGAG